MLSNVGPLCLSVLQWNKWILKTVIGAIFYLISSVWSLIHGIVVVPVSTTLRCFMKLITLPINIPLYIISGTSIQSIIYNTAKSINTELIIIVFQYVVVLILSGILLGITVGIFLGIVHINTYLRDYILEFNIRAAIKRQLQRTYNYVLMLATNIVLYIKTKAQGINKFKFKTSRDDNDGIEITTDDLNIPLQWLKNFNFTEDMDAYDATTVKEEHTISNNNMHKPKIPFNTPPGSPKLNSPDTTKLPNESLDSSTLKTSTLKQRRTRKVDKL